MPDNNNIEHRMEKLEDEFTKLKESFSRCTGNKEVLVKIEYMEKEIESLKIDSEEHYKNNGALQQTLTRLEELTKFLKESLESNKQSTQQLIDKVDKMYLLMFEYLQTTNDKDSASKNEINIVNDSNNTPKSEAVDNNANKISASKIFQFMKDYQTLLLILAGIIFYLLTGHLPTFTQG